MTTNNSPCAPCGNPAMGEHACSNRSQCWEPCGDMGRSEAHVAVAPDQATLADEQLGGK